MSGGQTRVEGDMSEAIRIARVVCIFFMMSVHVWPGASLILAANAPAFLSASYEFVINYLGRGSVSLLSVVSGYLFAVSLKNRSPDPARILRRKFETLIIPMIVWSLALLVMKLGYAAAVGAPHTLATSANEWINLFLALTAPPANAPLAFLRDIFACVALCLIVYPVFRKSRVVALAALAAINFADFALGGVLLLRPAILTFYGLGIVVAVAGVNPLASRWPLTLVLLAVDGLVRSTWASGIAADFGVLLNIGHRLAIALLMWALSLWIVAHARGLKALILTIEPSIFVIFCSHMLTIGLAGRALSALGTGPDQPVYALFILLQLILAILVGVALRTFFVRRASALVKVMTGVRAA